MTLSDFFLVAHLTIETKLFCFYQNFISSAFREIMGVQNSVTTKQTSKQTKCEQTTNKQNPRANNES